jgi:plasmid stabilization system protein ParE
VTRKAWRLTRQAEASLTDIARWTLERFGPRQAEAYEGDLIARCEQIADGTAPWQSCQRVIDPSLPEHLRFTRAGQHLVVFVEQTDAIIIVDFLHGRSDLPTRLANLVERGP